MAHVKDYLDRGPIYIDSWTRCVHALLLTALTRAVDLQIEFWNALEQVNKLATVKLDPARWVSTTRTMVDQAEDLTMADVDEYLGSNA